MRIKCLLAKSFIIISMILIGNSAFGKHIVGGEASYKLISSDKKIGGNATYQIRFIIYRDAKSGGGNFDNPAFFGVFKKVDDDWIFYNRQDITIKNRANIRNVTNPCLVAPKEIQYEKGEYVFNITLPIIKTSYRITYQRCCRTNFIVNIYAPESTGATYSVDITPEAQLLGNSSPQLTEFPPTVLCADTYFKFDHSAKDPDGDSLVYEFFNPLNGGGLAGSTPGTQSQRNNCNGIIPLPDNCPPPYPTVNFKPPYSFNEPIKGNPAIKLDRYTGFLSGKPIGFGQYVVGVKVKEYRNGVYIGSVKRDFQFQVTTCSPAVNAVIDKANQVDVDEFELFGCGLDTFTIKNISFYKNKIKTVYWEFDIDGQKVTDTDWDATIAFPDTGVYYGKLVLNKDIECEDSADIKIRIFPGIDADFDYSFDTCNVDSVRFFDKSVSGAGPIQKWNWIFGDGNKSDLTNPVNFFDNPGKYNSRLIVEDINKCKDTTFSLIKYFPLAEKIDFEPSVYSGCTPLLVNFSNSTVNFTDEYQILWDFGDGETSAVYSPSHIFKDSGIFDVNIKITSPWGCTLESNNISMIEVKKSPKADFTYSPVNPNIIFPKISFINNSRFSRNYQWEFGTGDISNEFEPQYTYRDTGLFKILLIAIANNNCADTAYKSLFINSDITIFFPNAFTPNGDGTNDEFFGKLLYPNFIKNYVLRIWDRWGGLVFESDDPTETWYGSKFNSGGILPQGVYVYKYYYNSPSGKIFKGDGFVTLIK